MLIASRLVVSLSFLFACVSSASDKEAPMPVEGFTSDYAKPNPENAAMAEIQNRLITAGSASFRLRVLRDPEGELVVIFNRGEKPLLVEGLFGLASELESGESMSWGCGGEVYSDTLTFTSAEGIAIQSVETRCGDVIYLTPEE